MRILIFYFISICPSLIFSQTWQVTTLAPIPEPVSNNAVCEGFINDTAFVFTFGGIDTTKIYSGIHNRSYRLNTVTNSWLQIPDLPDPIGKIAAAASRIGDIIYIAGGYHVMSNGNEISSSKMHRYRISTNTFMADATDIPVAIDDQVQCVWRDSLIYLITGWSNNTNVPNVQIYNPQNDSWAEGSPVTDNNIYKAFGASGNIIGDTIYYFGGASAAGNFPAQKILRKGVINKDIPTAITWEHSIPNSDERGYRSACAVVDHQICWIGGSSSSYNYDGIAYNGSGGVPPLKRCLWYDATTGISTVDTLNQFPMDLRGLASVSDSLKYIVGGMAEGQQVSANSYALRYMGNLTGIKNIDLAIDPLALYPNPASDFVIIKLSDNEGEFDVKVIDVQGKTVIQQRNQYKIDIAILPQGAYTIRVHQGNTIQVATLIHH